jgi:hypothetical protein
MVSPHNHQEIFLKKGKKRNMILKHRAGDVAQG